jgi:hypothetical protein
MRRWDQSARKIKSRNGAVRSSVAKFDGERSRTIRPLTKR